MQRVAIDDLAGADVRALLEEHPRGMHGGLPTLGRQGVRLRARAVVSYSATFGFLEALEVHSLRFSAARANAARWKAQKSSPRARMSRIGS